MKSIQDTPSWGSATGKEACVVTSGCPHLGQYGLLIKRETYTCSRLDYTYVGTLALPFTGCLVLVKYLTSLSSSGLTCQTAMAPTLHRVVMGSKGSHFYMKCPDQCLPQCKYSGNVTSLCFRKKSSLEKNRCLCKSRRWAHTLGY